MTASTSLLAALSPNIQKHALTDIFTVFDSQQVPHATVEKVTLPQALKYLILGQIYYLEKLVLHKPTWHY